METTIPTRTIPERPVASALPDNLSNPDPETESRLLAFAEAQIDKMRAAASVGNVDGQPGYYELNRALADYQTVNLGLISVYAVAKTELSEAIEAFDDWFSEKYLEIRDELNPRSLTPTKWYGAKEIEMHVRVRYKEEFRRLERAKSEADHKLSVLRRLLDSWANHQFVLSRLCKNVDSEMVGSAERGDGY